MREFSPVSPLGNTSTWDTLSLLVLGVGLVVTSGKVVVHHDIVTVHVKAGHVDILIKTRCLSPFMIVNITGD